MTGRSGHPGYATCEPCGKRGYFRRAEARALAKQIGGDPLHTYRCPHGGGWHLGHLPRAVRNGTWPKTAYEQAKPPRRSA